MRGQRSFMKYFNGSLWDALAQDYSAKLAAALKGHELAPVLKKWRDSIIQNTIVEGRISQAGSYTKYVDALAQVLQRESKNGISVSQLSAEEIRESGALDRSTYNTARKRIRRRIDKKYPNGWDR